MLPRGGTMVKRCIVARERDQDGNPIGLANSNPILDTRSYIIHFDNGDQTELTANMISESLYSQCDPNGYKDILLNEIVDHRRTDTAIKLADQKVVRANSWYKAETRPTDNFRYYAYILCYVDNILCMHHGPMIILDQINEYMPLKPSLVGDPDIYLSAKLKQTRLPNGVWAWGQSPSKYVAQAVKNRQTRIYTTPTISLCKLTIPSHVTVLLRWTRLTHLTQNACHSTNNLSV